jgi:trans-aconitate methyltransferase
MAAGSLFLLKMAYVLSVAVVLPVTRGALYVSTSRKRIAAFLDAVPVQPGQVVIDLGCGDGRVLRMVRRRYGTCTIGYEMNPVAYIKARILCAGVGDISVRMQNFWKADLSAADVVFCYLFPDVMVRLSEKLRRELKPGATVVSCNFELPGWQPGRILRPGNSLHNDPIYIYKIS